MGGRTYLISAAIKGKRLAPGVAYLGIPNILTAKSDDSLSLDDILKAFQCVAANVTKKAAEEYVALLKSGKSKDQAMETCSQSRFIAAKMHTYGYIFTMFKESIEEMEDSDETKVLVTVCKLYGLWVIDEQSGHFLKCKWDIPRSPHFGVYARLELMIRRILLASSDRQDPNCRRCPLRRSPSLRR